jgi:hypothetical protein
MAKSGWYRESKRHSLASKGIKTAQKINPYPVPMTLRKKIVKLGKTNPLPFIAKGIDTFHLQIETAFYVPSTQDKDNNISELAFKERISEVENWLAANFGGYSRVDMMGGYKLDNGKVVKEKAARVVCFADTTTMLKKQDDYKQFILQKRKEWGQDSIGFEVEGDLYYIKEKEE